MKTIKDFLKRFKDKRKTIDRSLITFRNTALHLKGEKHDQEKELLPPEMVEKFKKLDDF